MKTTSLIFSCIAPALVVAHGYVSQVTIDGKAYQGNVPNANPTDSGIRQIDTIDPVKFANNTYLFCGQDAQVAALDLAANPGSQMTITWSGGDNTNWPHNTGPLMTYMASCGSTPCNEFNSTDAKWFKIDQLGRQEPGGDWYQEIIFNGGVANVTIPPTLAPGNYLLRHEIIALHLATELYGAEFYPSCTQLTVDGSETGVPTDDELVSFPGAYNDNDPGIYDPDVYDTSAPYTFPGPAVAQFVTSSSSSSSGGESSGTTTATGPQATITTAPSSSGSSKTCKLKKKPSTNSNSTTFEAVARRKPRHLSRIMRDLRTSFQSLH